MELSDRLLEHDLWLTARLLENAATLSDEALDRPIRPSFVVHEFEGPEPDVRTMLERIIFTQEVWTAAIARRDIPPRDRRSIPDLQARQASAAAQLRELVESIRTGNRWDEIFTDALCTPPASFTLGSVIAHILNVGIVRRHMVISALKELGAKDVESRDPIEWERTLATASAKSGG